MRLSRSFWLHQAAFLPCLTLSSCLLSSSLLSSIGLAADIPSNGRFWEKKPLLLADATGGSPSSSIPSVPSRPHPGTNPSPSPTVQPATLRLQGNRILINGRPYSTNWMQWGSNTEPEKRQTAIVDLGATQVLGLELLSSLDPRQQSVRWFSWVTPLSTLLLDQQRFLNVTPLLQAAGWQVNVQNETLVLTPPPAQMTGLRWSRRAPGDRTVVELDRPTAWQSQWQGGDLILTLEGNPNPDLQQQLNPSLEAIARNALQHSPGPQVQTTNGQTQIRISVASGLFPTVTTLSNPTRLVIDTTPSPLPNREIVWTPGLRWRQKMVQVGQERFPVVWLSINPRQPGLAVRPFWSNPQTQVGTAPLVSTAKLWQAVAAINAGFFNRNTQLPLGVIRRDGQWASGPILNRGAIAWNNQGEFRIGRFSLQENLTTADGKQFPVITLNSGYVQAGISRYTTDWGATYTPILNDEILIAIQNQQVTGYAEGGPAGQTAFPIPSNGYLLVLRANKSAIPSFPLNSVVKLTSQPEPDEFLRFPHIIGAGPLLIQNRRIVLDAAGEKFSPAFIRETAVRSAIGRTSSGELLLVTVQSQPHGAEPSLDDMAKIMEQLGAIDALNLDGGSSTTLYLGGWVLNRSAQSTARVHNGIGVFLEPTGRN